MNIISLSLRDFKLNWHLYTKYADYLLHLLLANIIIYKFCKREYDTYIVESPNVKSLWFDHKAKLLSSPVRIHTSTHSNINDVALLYARQKFRNDP